MSKMYLMCGLSGAGKTTFAKKFAEENRYRYLCIDNFYASYYEKDKTVYDNEEISFKVWIKFFEAIHEAEMAGIDVVIDTNAPTYSKRQDFIDWFPKFDEHNLIYISINDFLLQEKNNGSRARVVPKEELRRMRKEFQEPVSFSQYSSNTCFNREKNWDHIIVYKNIDNVLIPCKVIGD